MTSVPVTGTAAGVGRTAAFVDGLHRQPVVAVVRHADAGVAAEIARGCIAGGLVMVEITLTTPGACALIAELTAEAPAGVMVGAGTVLDVGQVAAAEAAGASFLVSPTTEPRVLAAAGATGLPFVPGAATPSEIATAAHLGAPVVKLFPAGGLGLPFLRSVRAVLPHVPLLPSGGIGVADLPAWLAAGALAVAVGSELDAAHARGGRSAVTALAASAAAAAERCATPSTVTRHDPRSTQ